MKPQHFPLFLIHEGKIYVVIGWDERSIGGVIFPWAVPRWEPGVPKVIRAPVSYFSSPQDASTEMTNARQREAR